MIIEINRLPPEGKRFVGEEPPDILELERVPLARSLGPVRYDLFAEMASHQLIVRGVLSMDLEVQCSRCAGFFSTTAGDSSFLRAYELSEGTETVDVTGDIREGILLQLPTHPLCRQDCRGLCPQCGRNLNEGACDCAPPSTGGPWGGLEKLKL